MLNPQRMPWNSEGSDEKNSKKNILLSDTHIFCVQYPGIMQQVGKR